MAGQTYIFAGGGTGGHLFPGLAVATAIRNQEPQSRIAFVGSERSLESDLVTRNGFAHRGLSAEPLSLLKKRPVRFLWRNWTAYRQARAMLSQERPSAVIGLGGFASAPLVVAAYRLSIPTILLEQNSIPGRSTRWLSRWSSAVCLSYPESARHFSARVNVRITGNPVREEIARLVSPDPRVSCFERSGSTSRTLLILGGSQGAQPLNEAMSWLIKSHPSVLHDWQIIHQSGQTQELLVQERYRNAGFDARVTAFLSDMAEQYQAADVVITRAGATTLAELACAGLPSILVPYPQAADNHQWHNARVFEAAGAASIVLQGATPEETSRGLLKQLELLTTSSDVLTAMSSAMRKLARPQATQSVVDVLRELLEKQ